MNQPLLQGVGVGLRACHYSYIETEKPTIPWFEVLSDNYLSLTGESMNHLEKIRASYPMTLHGVGMSLGSTDPINKDYLKKLKALTTRIKPLMVSDHLCWTSFDGQHFHELLPLPYTHEAVSHIVQRIQTIQEFLDQRIMIENVSSYLSFKDSHLFEWEFLQTVAEKADCWILLDINNIYVSAFNNTFSPESYLNLLSTDRIAQFHLGGFENRSTYLLDTHGSTIHGPVWELYKHALQKFGPIPTLIEWDNNIPEFPLLFKEAEKAAELMEKYAYSQ